MITPELRVVRCRLVVDTFGSDPGILDEQVGVRMAADTPRRWLHSADMVGMVTGLGPSVDEVFGRLPGCRAIVSTGSSFLVHIRDVAQAIPVPNAASALSVAMLAGSCPWDHRDRSALVGELGRSALKVERSKGETPAADVWIRLRGSRVRCTWTVLG